MRSLWISQLWILAAVFYDAGGQQPKQDPGGVIKLPGDFSKCLGFTGVRGTTDGKNFVVAFRLSRSSADKIPNKCVFINSEAPASVTLNNPYFKKEIMMDEGQTAVVPITTNTEPTGSTKTTDTVMIEADTNISIMSQTDGNGCGDFTFISPLDNLGMEYYIMAPPNGPMGQSTQIILISLKSKADINLYVTGSVTSNGRKYSKGETITLNLMPNESFEIRSQENLSGTKVVANQDIAVIAGFTFSQNNAESCSHFYGLWPITSWRTYFLIPGDSIQSENDIVYVMASQNTTITYKSGTGQVTMEVGAGKLGQIKPTQFTPLSIQSNHGIQVLRYGLKPTYENVAGEASASG
ncbi:hypothetical protein GDO81_014641 [Engystomops pustulosus]|uniref:IgGFc-binding protein N-terminal domain-containing protein n=1 Tax=Engystomops pustulosus TaxID=76066 RepID=A0AAV7BCA3_ENGPU|nr:hypothetical protein GDO81_014641 [Engystomops pustulosus]